MTEAERLAEIDSLARNQLSHYTDLPPRKEKDRVMLSGMSIRVRETLVSPERLGIFAICGGKSYHWTGRRPRKWPYGLVIGREWTIESNRRLASKGE